MRKEPITINVAATCRSTRVLGPGSRFAIWVQGCCFACLNCGTPAWRTMEEATLVTPEFLANQVLKTPGIDGITISGGEPMLQTEGLAELVKIVRMTKPLSVICYTGFTLEELKDKNDPHIDAFLAEIDVLIDGPYIDHLNDNRGLRGSTSQKIHFLSGLYQEFAADFANCPRDQELHLFPDEYLLVGLKPHRGQQWRL